MLAVLLAMQKRVHDYVVAGQGVGYFALVWSSGGGLSRNILGGSQTLMDAIAAELGDRVRTAVADFLRGAIGGDAADRHLGLGEAFAAIGGEAPIGEASLCKAKVTVGHLAKLAFRPQLLAKPGGEPVGEALAEQLAQSASRPGALGFEQP